MKKATKLVSGVLAALMATSAFTATGFAAAKTPTKEDCDAAGEQKIYFQFPTDGTWGDHNAVKVSGMTGKGNVYCLIYAVYGNEYEFFNSGWETSVCSCTAEDKDAGLYSYDINSKMTVTLDEIDPATGTPVGEIERCTFTYNLNGEKVTVPFSAKTHREYYEKALGVTNFTGFEKPVLNKKFTKHGEWYYTALANWCCQGSIPVIVRTKDGINYEEVFRCTEFKYGASENEIAIHNDRLYIISRTARPEQKLRAGTFLGVYTLDGECIRKPYQIGDVESRPEMIVYKDEVYAFYNVKPYTINYETGKNVNRSRVRLSKLDDHGSVVCAWEYASPYSMQYFSLDEYKGKLYLSFIEDRFGRVKAKKGNLSFVEINL